MKRNLKIRRGSEAADMARKLDKEVERLVKERIEEELRNRDGQIEELEKRNSDLTFEISILRFTNSRKQNLIEKLNDQIRKLGAKPVSDTPPSPKGKYVEELEELGDQEAIYVIPCHEDDCDDSPF